MTEKDLNQTIDYLLDLIEALSEENKILMEQNKALSKEILSLEKGGKLKRKMTLDEALELAYKESRKNTRNTWVINKTNKGSN
jgi:hypothetical protein